MFLDKEYFDGWMQRLSERLERIEKLCAGTWSNRFPSCLTGERLLDNYDLCRMLNISKRTLQRYRTSGELPYEMIYHKTFLPGIGRPCGSSSVTSVISVS